MNRFELWDKVARCRLQQHFRLLVALWFYYILKMKLSYSMISHNSNVFSLHRKVHLTSSNFAAIMLKAFIICDVEPITETIRSANDASEMLTLAQL